MKKNSKNSTATVSAKQNPTLTKKEPKALNRVAVPFRNKNVNQSVAIYEVESNGINHRVIGYLNMTLDAYLVALPQTGLKAQGKDRVLAVPKNDTLKAKFRVSNWAIAKLTKAVNSSCRGKSWKDYCNEVATMTKAELVRDKDGHLVFDENGKVQKTGNFVSKYSTYSSKSEGLKDRDVRILNFVKKYLDSLYKREGKAESQPKAEDKTSKKSA